MKRILIIEDDTITANAYRTRLLKEDCEVELAEDGQIGFYKIQQSPPDGVLLDLMLPKISGVEILKKIRAQSQFKALPIVVLTNAFVPSMVQDAYNAGANAVLNKATLTPSQVTTAILYAISCGILPSYQVPPDALPKFKAPESLMSAPPMPPVCSSTSTITSSLVERVTPAPRPGQADEPLSPHDTEFLAEVLKSFVDLAPETLSNLRKALQDFSKARSEAERTPALHDFYRKTHSLAGSAAVSGLRELAKMASALEALLKELHEKPQHISPSTLRTAATAVDLIGGIFRNGLDPKWEATKDASILVVDDELLSRKAMMRSLEISGLPSCGVDNSRLALELAQTTPYDLILLDVQISEMDGFELCKQLHASPTNQTTPVLFVTSQSDFKSRARSTLSGGADLIAKPFLFVELGVKALTYVLRSKLAKREQQLMAA